jgi:hypothetical protein
MLSYVSPIACQTLPADCLERDSPRDQLVVTLFLLTVFGLLLGAGVKNRMIKAGLSADMPWNTGRRWWEVSTSPTTTDHSPTEYTLGSLGCLISRRTSLVSLALGIAQTEMCE